MKKPIWTGICGVCAAVLLLAGVGTGLLPGQPKENGTAVEAEAVPSDHQTDSEASVVKIHFIDVGQGDATLIQCGEHVMLIDAGDNDKGTAVQLYLTKQGVKKLDYLILTHPDADHIGGADVVITKFAIDRVFMADFEKDNQTYREVTDALASKKLKWTTPSPGTVYSLGTAEFTILAPNDTYEDPNNASIALLLQNGDTGFLFTGDGEEEAEEDILANGLCVEADVYKAGHHGSDTASCEAFLEAADPDYAVISCGEGNSYGHPHAAVLNSLRAMGIQVFRTDEQGSIIAESDGTKITWNCAPSETWQTGERTGSGARRKAEKQDKQPKGNYTGNKNNGKLHRSTCEQLPNEENRVVFETKQEAIDAGYDDPCGLCEP